MSNGCFIEITVAIFSYLFYCFVCFAFIYSGEKVKIWRDEEAPRPCYFDLVKEDVLRLKELDEFSMQCCIENKIGPKYHYFTLMREIEKYQSDYEYDMSCIFLPLFFLLLIAKAIIGLNLIKTWLISLLIVIVVGFFTFLLINLLYEKFAHFKIDQFLGDDYSEQHYKYLKSIKDTVIFRRSVRRILLNITGIIYFLFFFTIPE